MRVLVTGGAGFIGHHLVQALVENGTDVLVVDDLSRGVASRLPSAVKLETVDIAGPGIESVVMHWRPRLVFHLAARTDVVASMRAPREDLRVNGIGTINVLDAVSRAGADRIVFVSSGGAIYGETDTPATEESPLQPTSYYGIHKLLAEQYVHMAGVPFAIARPSNVYGQGQTAGSDGAVVASFAQAITRGQPQRIDGDGAQTRDFIHVDDVVRALLLLADAPAGRVWNIASGTSTSIVDLADLMARVSGTPTARVFGPERPGDIRHSRLSAERLRALGWVGRVTLTDGLRDLIAAERDSNSMWES